VDSTAVATELQREGTATFARSWRDLMHRIASKIEVLTQTHPGGSRHENR
jgi:transaldolase